MGLAYGPGKQQPKWKGIYEIGSEIIDATDGRTTYDGKTPPHHELC